MVAQIKGHEKATVTSSPKLGDMSYEEWKEAHRSSPKPRMIAKSRSGNKKTESPVAKIKNAAVISRYGNIKQNVFMPERIVRHVKDSHPGDYEKHLADISNSISEPKAVYESKTHSDRAIFVGEGKNGFFKTVVEMAPKESETRRSMVVTLHTVGNRTLKKMEKNYKLVFKAE